MAGSTKAGSSSITGAGAGAAAKGFG